MLPTSSVREISTFGHCDICDRRSILSRQNRWQLPLSVLGLIIATASCTALRSGTSSVSRRCRTRRLASCIWHPSKRAPRLCASSCLPIRQGITYKLVTLTFKAKYCRTPLYLHEQLRDHQAARALRFTTAPLFYRPFVSTVSASRAFYYSVPQVWNCLGASNRSANTFNSFRRCLKSELFAAA